MASFHWTALVMCLAVITFCTGKPLNTLDKLRNYLEAVSQARLISRSLEERDLESNSTSDQRFTCSDNAYTNIDGHSTGLLQNPTVGHAYLNDFNCGWTVTVSPGKVVQLEWQIFQVEEGDYGCEYDAVSVFDGGDRSSSSPVATYCGTALPPTFTSTTNKVTVTFSSDETITMRGFRVKFTEVEPTDNAVLTEVCGSHVVLEESAGKISFPSGGDQYPNDCDKTWTITIPSPQKINIHFNSISIEDDSRCAYDYLKIYDGPSNTSSLLGNLCGTTPPRGNIISSGDTVFLKFHSDDSIRATGFDLDYSSCDTCAASISPSTTTTPTTTTTAATEGCGSHVVLEESAGNIVFPSSGGQYPNDCDKTWKISIPAPHGIHIQFNSISIEDDSRCAYDYLKLYDGPSNTSPLLGNLCGTTPPSSIISSGDTVFLKFHSDDSVRATGFNLDYSPCDTCAPTPSPTTTTTTPTTTTTAAIAALQDVSQASCDFESGTCGWTQDTTDVFDWLRHSSSTPTSETGPSSDHTLGDSTGHYMYIESSDPRRAGDRARLNSPLLSSGTGNGRCVSFWYFMSGRGVGTFRVLLKKQGASDEVIWQRSGDLGSVWNRARVSIETDVSFTVSFEGTTTGSIWGDMAIDDVTISEGHCSSIASHCGRSLYTKRILGGEETLRHQYPWIVHMKTHSNGGFHKECGGTLIDRKWVMTAAHCLELGGTRVTDPSLVKLHFGEHNVAVDESEDFVATPDLIQVHPQRAKFGPAPYDIALLRLAEPVELTDAVNPVCLPSATDSFPPGTMCTVSGWGRIGTLDGADSDVLLHVNISLVPNYVCGNVFGSALANEDTICAKHSSEEKSSCQGDSGGPLVTKKDDYYIVLGVVSYGATCGQTNAVVPSGYASVQYFLSWIETTIANNP